jgi:RNA polymerase sigma-70 factor (ECF subfamily)
MPFVSSEPLTPAAPVFAPVGETSALAALYAEHFAFVWRSARRLGVPLDALDDAVQDVFVVAHKKLPEFEGRSSLRTWLFGITRKVARDYRASRARATSELELDRLAAQQSGPQELAERAQSAQLLQSMLDELDEERRAAFILVDLEELSVPEAASALGVNVNTLYSRVRAARQDLSRALARVRARNQRSEPWNR